MKRIQALTLTICSLMIIGLLLQTRLASAQNKFPDAIERSGNAAKIIQLVSLVPDDGIPKAIISKAEAIGVFPEVERLTAFLAQVSEGYGVISARQGSGWTSPGFYRFSGGGYGNPLAKNDKYGIILLFMTKDAVEAFEKGRMPLKNEKRALGGPAGPITDAQRKELEGVNILAYAYYNGNLKGTTFGKSFWKKFALDPDNKINKPLYGIKGREVLAGKQVDTKSLPAGITAYQEALEKYCGK